MLPILCSIGLFICGSLQFKSRILPYLAHKLIFATIQTYLNFTALITETKGKLTTPNVANRVDAFVIPTQQTVDSSYLSTLKNLVVFR
jgi:hypothetical protein